jgi:SAM-dependent MidA family methyltransferase
MSVVSTTTDGPGSPGPGPADGEPRLVARIREEIELAPGRRITFARFMERALTEPGLGYYATSELRPTRAGDFLTAPELHPFFGRCVGRALTARWSEVGSPPRFVVREFGAGRGTLRDAVVAGSRADGSGLADALAWQPIDLPGRHPGADDTRADVVIANEYLDALPVHRLVIVGGAPRESWVTWQDGRFAWTDGELSSPSLVESLQAAGIELREGQVLEVRPAVTAWVEDVARAKPGLVLVIDYGHETSELYGPRRHAGTLMTYRGHAVGDDPFVAVGRQDITAHVDLGQLRSAAQAHGCLPVTDTTLGRWLAGLGLGELLSDLGRDPAADPQAYADARAAVLRLLDPRHLGGQRVLAFVRA